MPGIFFFSFFFKITQNLIHISRLSIIFQCFYIISFFLSQVGNFEIPYPVSMLLYIYIYICHRSTMLRCHTLPFTFYNLKNLKLYPDFTQMHPILFMFTLLRSCHNLEKLEIEVMLDVAFWIPFFTLFKGNLVVYS